MNNVFIHEAIEDLFTMAEIVAELDKDVRHEYNKHHRQMIDLQHEMELSEQYTEDMKAHVFDQMQEVARNRRKAKDTMLVIDSLNKVLHNGTTLTNLREALVIASEEIKRNYMPREFKSLDFSNSDSLFESRTKIMEKTE